MRRHIRGAHHGGVRAALVSLALGVLILARWPSTAVWALGLLVGIDLAISGTSMLLIGLGAGPAAHARRL